MKIKFIVVNENILGYVLPSIPNSCQILSSSIVRGASVTWVNGSYPISSNGKNWRLATKTDFETFRVNYSPYEQEPERYEELAKSK
jgi:hypothetical protein